MVTFVYVTLHVIHFAKVRCQRNETEYLINNDALQNNALYNMLAKNMKRNKQLLINKTFPKFHSLYNDSMICVGNFMFRNTNLNVIYDNVATSIEPKLKNKPKEILLIGIGYPDKMKKDWNNMNTPILSSFYMKKSQTFVKVPDIRAIKVFNPVMGKMVPINENQIKDFLRATIIEEIHHPCIVHSISNLGDELRGNRNIKSRNDINVKVCSRFFIPSMRKRNWKIDEISFDYFRMQNSYVGSMFGPKFFENLKEMVTHNLFNIPAQTTSGRPEIYLPFSPHFFMHVHGINLGECYAINYITTNDLSERSLNALYNATKSDIFSTYCSIYKLEVCDHEHNITYKKRDFLQFSQPFIETRIVTKLLNEIEYEIESIRFILLTV